jgi:50S ribosomal protein L16 3-hydroxylase
MARDANGGSAPDASRPGDKPSNAVVPLLGGHRPAAFLARFWHKHALLARQAIPGFAGFLDLRALIALACRDDVESRLVIRDGARWTLAHGPFRRADFKTLPARNWTLLVQGVNLVRPDADALLRRFSFVPFARLDDLMVSYAAPGGGVGPHFDSYDVFLLQGFGRRRWRYGRQDDLALRPRLPLQILRRFLPEHDDVLAAGDLLYLPPQYAHDGIALDACTTYSIGFRAAGATELATAFLDFLRDRIDLPGRYADPDLSPVREPARIAVPMQRRYARMLAAIRWDQTMVARFLGCWLSEPKPAVFFERPARPLSRSAFLARVARRGIRLDTRTQLFYDNRDLFINGNALPWPVAGADAIKCLANARALGRRMVTGAPDMVHSLFHDWYRDGFLHPDSKH